MFLIYIMSLYEQIFADFSRGDVTSFYKRMYPEILIFTARLLGDNFAFLAEDCVQNAVFKTYNRYHTFTSSLQWKVFLYTCVRNEAINILRKGQAQRNYLEQQNEENEDLVLEFIEQETLTLLYNAIESLPQKYKDLFEMSFERGLKNREVAELLSVAEVTVKKQKAQLIEMLRLRLKGKIEDPYFSLLILILLGA